MTTCCWGVDFASLALKRLFDFFVDSVFVAVGAELFQLNPCRSVTAVFHCGVARNSGRSLIWVSATLGTFQRDHNANTFTLSHNPKNSRDGTNLGRQEINFLDANTHYFTRRLTSANIFLSLMSSEYPRRV